MLSIGNHLLIAALITGSIYLHNSRILLHTLRYLLPISRLWRVSLLHLICKTLLLTLFLISLLVLWIFRLILLILNSIHLIRIIWINRMTLRKLPSRCLYLCSRRLNIIISLVLAILFIVSLESAGLCACIISTCRQYLFRRECRICLNSLNWSCGILGLFLLFTSHECTYYTNSHSKRRYEHKWFCDLL